LDEDERRFISLSISCITSELPICALRSDFTHWRLLFCETKADVTTLAVLTIVNLTKLVILRSVSSLSGEVGASPSRKFCEQSMQMSPLGQRTHDRGESRTWRHDRGESRTWRHDHHELTKMLYFKLDFNLAKFFRFNLDLNYLSSKYYLAFTDFSGLNGSRMKMEKNGAN
jgi:hypothetical protein